VVFTLVTEGRVRRAYLGVAVVSRPAKTQNGFAGGAGVENVAPNSPAERAGVRAQDIIVGFGEEPVRSNDELLSKLDESAIGRDAQLRVLRGGRELTLKVRPQELPAE
jgi:S1-C subfamily serine protease